jgi:hypothetical protein
MLHRKKLNYVGHAKMQVFAYKVMISTPWLCFEVCEVVVVEFGGLSVLNRYGKWTLLVPSLHL